MAGALGHLREPRHSGKAGTREVDAGGIHRDQHVAGKNEQLSAGRNRQTIRLAHDEVEEGERTPLLGNARQRRERLAHRGVCGRAAAVPARMAHEDAASLEGILPFRATLKLHQHVQRGAKRPDTASAGIRHHHHVGAVVEETVCATPCDLLAVSCRLRLVRRRYDDYVKHAEFLQVKLPFLRRMFPYCAVSLVWTTANALPART